MSRVVSFVLILFLLVACSPQPPADTGIQGQVLIGPTCPVVRPGQACQDQPYQATLTVLTETGSRVIRFTTDADGRFRIPLAPGTYVLHPESPDGKYPLAPEQTLAVTEGEFTEISVAYDSGIR